MQTIRRISTSFTFEVPSCGATRWKAPVTGQLRACRDRIWLTREGDLTDYWLDAGQSLEIAGGQALWVGAEGGEPVYLQFVMAESRSPRLQIAWQTIRRALRLPAGTSGALIGRR
jgi:hypothetical protein